MDEMWKKIIRGWLGSPRGAFEGVRNQPAEHPLLKTPISELTLKVRTRNCLINENLETIREILEYTPAQLLAVHGFGKFCLKDLTGALQRLGQKKAETE